MNGRGTTRCAHHVDKAGEFRRLLAARGHHRKQRGDFDFRNLAGKDLGEDLGGLLAGERGAVFGKRFQEIFDPAHG